MGLKADVESLLVSIFGEPIKKLIEENYDESRPKILRKVSVNN